VSARLALLAILVVADPEQCRNALAAYNDAVIAVHAAVRDYERCITSSLGRDGCGAELIELQATHRDFEAVVDERASNCRGIELYRSCR
jgi:hypothetical protein